ncbi:hypothetical protein EV217_5052 [Phyllobacterium myrsinacearum]|nr:hypothetical protein EV217_5052 [Phyllobacterium myrsinacearum]
MPHHIVEKTFSNGVLIYSCNNIVFKFLRYHMDTTCLEVHSVERTASRYPKANDIDAIKDAVNTLGGFWNPHLKDTLEENGLIDRQE